MEPASLKIVAGEAVKVEQLAPSKKATNDYEVASAFFDVEAAAGADVVIHFENSNIQHPTSREIPSAGLQKGLLSR